MILLDLGGNVVLSRYRRLFRYPLRRWPILILIFSLTGLTTAVTVLQPWPMKILVDYALGSMNIPTVLNSILTVFSLSPSPEILIFFSAIASLGLFVFNKTLALGLNWAWAVIGQRSVYDLAADLFHRLQRLSLLFHSRRNTGDSLNLLTMDTYCVYTIISRLLISPAQHLLTLVTIGLVAWSMDPSSTAITLLIVPAMAGMSYLFGPRLKRRARKSREVQSHLMSFVHQTLTAMPVVKAFGTEESNLQQFQHLADNVIDISQHSSLLDRFFNLLNSLTSTICTAIILYFGGQLVLLDALSLGGLLVFLSYTNTLLAGFRGLFSIYATMKSTEASIDRVMEVLEAQEEVQDAPDAQPLPIHKPGPRGHIRLEHVSFGYEPDRPVLKDISLEAHPGETVALVGPTGAGKSTLVSLIPRFFDPWEGRVLFDGIDVRKVKLASLRAQISLVLQEPFLLPLTVAENIAYGRPGASRDEIVAAAVAARADEFIRQLPQGYDTVIGERGATLSGGEKQRLAIARALLKDAPVLILDEPTSALDAETETQLMEALECLMEGRTTIIIAHRLSTIRLADLIVVLEEGQVAEEGTHETLLEVEGSYHRLHTLQFFGSIREETS
jgi:ATP-binding cassette subfamily B protein